ncbi:MAG: hypothetical protein COB41_01260 [Proteobacteria bacterium]|nr:MAG: hypothetical protein COB41_01260 [Pseudomonadota bacterium]
MQNQWGQTRLIWQVYNLSFYTNKLHLKIASKVYSQKSIESDPIDFSDDDRLAYLEWLQAYCEQHDVQILAYCLMTNHIHLVAVPHSSDGLQKVFKPLHMRYAQRMNQSRVGKVICGRGAFFLRRWMKHISGLLFVMWSATLCVRIWWSELRIIVGLVREDIAA